MKTRFATAEILSKLKELNFTIAKPLWQDVEDWLRIKYGLFLVIRPLHWFVKEPVRFEAYFITYKSKKENIEFYNSYEQAREKSILKALESIKNAR